MQRAVAKPSNTAMAAFWTKVGTSKAEVRFSVRSATWLAADVRERLAERESGRINEDKSLVDALVFWRKKTPPKSLVNPKLEAERLRDNAALGKPATAGKTPILEK